ncbi:MAG: hypothetical protein JWN24_1583 [Phycisphaerales bacterium]|nr:hypothetical protein [Phycisphaerales bacterium]
MAESGGRWASGRCFRPVFDASGRVGEPRAAERWPAESGAASIKTWRYQWCERYDLFSPSLARCRLCCWSRSWGVWCLDSAIVFRAAPANGRCLGLVIQAPANYTALWSIAPWPHSSILDLNPDSAGIALVPEQDRSNDTEWNALGAHYFSSWGRPLGPHGPVSTAVRHWAVTLPFWSLALLLSLPPGAWTVRHFARQRRCRRLRTAGLCVHCGHDVKALAICPRCEVAVTSDRRRLTRRQLLIASVILPIAAFGAWGGLAWCRHVRELAAESKYRPYSEKTIPVVNALDLCLTDLDHNGTLSEFERHFRAADALEKTWFDSLSEPERSYHSCSSIRWLIWNFSSDVDTWHRGNEHPSMDHISSEAISLMEIRRYMLREKLGRSQGI